MESVDTIDNLKTQKSFKVNFTEWKVFLLLFFLNLKFAYITIIQERNMMVDILVYIFLILAFDFTRLRNRYINLFLLLIPFTVIHFSEFKLNVLMPLIVAHAVGSIKFKRYLWMNFIIMGGTILIMYLVYGEGRNMAGYTWGMSRKSRMSFGFNHPNVATLYYYCFMINALLMLYFSKLKKWIPIYVIITIPITYYIYNKTGARSFIFAVWVLYISYAYYYGRNLLHKNYKVKYTKYLLVFLPLILLFITAYFALNVEDYQVLNKMLSRRLYYYNKLLTGIDPMSFVFGTDAYREIIIDSSFIHLMFEGGIIFFLFFVYFYTVSSYKMGQENQWLLMVIFFSFLIYGLMETLLLYSMLIGTNIFWVILYYYFQDKKPTFSELAKEHP